MKTSRNNALYRVKFHSDPEIHLQKLLNLIEHSTSGCGIMAEGVIKNNLFPRMTCYQKTQQGFDFRDRDRYFECKAVNVGIEFNKNKPGIEKVCIGGLKSKKNSILLLVILLDHKFKIYQVPPKIWMPYTTKRGQWKNTYEVILDVVDEFEIYNSETNT